jgi:hypothetical protein
MRKRNTLPGAETDAVAACVREMLKRAGVAEDQQSLVGADVLGFYRSHAWRKLAGKSPLTVPELAQLAHHCEWSLGRLLLPLALQDAQALQDVTRAALDRDFEDAVLLIDEASVSCRVKLGGAATAASSCAFLAIGAPGKWVVLPRARVTTPARVVARLMYEGGGAAEEIAPKDGELPAGSA